MLGVPPATIERHGAVSRETAEAMARGALGTRAGRSRRRRSPASPDPAAAAPASRSASCISPPPRAAARLTHAEKRYGDIGRSEVRRQSVLQALALLQEARRQGRAAPAVGRELDRSMRAPAGSPQGLIRLRRSAASSPDAPKPAAPTHARAALPSPAVAARRRADRPAAWSPARSCRSEIRARRDACPAGRD